VSLSPKAICSSASDSVPEGVLLRIQRFFSTIFSVLPRNVRYSFLCTASLSVCKKEVVLGHGWIMFQFAGHSADVATKPLINQGWHDSRQSENGSFWQICLGYYSRMWAG
jgi:hypothetical protein